jgi:succinoglycan biosynthesis protein ExoL
MLSFCRYFNTAASPDSAVIAKIAYFAHDLSDPAVHRRLKMLFAGGAAVTAIGFRRSSEPVAMVDGITLIDLGRTADGMLLRRGLSVAVALARLVGLAEHVRGANVIVARNLEMLTLAIRARKLHAPSAAVVYECLDIHRMLLSKRLDGRLLRLLEKRLWREVNLLLTSSPAFVHSYFIPRGFRSPIRLIENKVLMLDELSEPDRKRLLSGPPWRIGWFGIIRCRRSLDMLCALARGAAGKVEIVIRGRPTKPVFQDLNELIARVPHIHFAGPYNNPADLSAIYGDVHFSWAIDYYEVGQNSTWLLPNRIYEGSFYGTVPIGVAGVETGRWLAERGAGVVLDEPLEQQLINFFRHLDNETYSKLAGQVEALPRTDLVSDQADCRALVEALHAAQYSAPLFRSEVPEISLQR